MVRFYRIFQARLLGFSFNYYIEMPLKIVFAAVKSQKQH